jgi:hypothetical protein
MFFTLWASRVSKDVEFYVYLKKYRVALVKNAPKELFPNNILFWCLFHFWIIMQSLSELESEFIKLNPIAIGFTKLI